MDIWRKNIQKALLDFITVAKLSGEILQLPEFEEEYLQAPHKQPQHLPKGKIAVYGFWWNGGWLKIGIVGPSSKARYTSQHYNPNSSRSNLAKSLIQDPRMAQVTGFTPEDPGAWIKSNTCRVNLLLPEEKGMELLRLLEAFLHIRLRPRYER